MQANYIPISISVYRHVCMCVLAYVSMHACMYICIHECMYTCMYVHMYMYVGIGVVWVWVDRINIDLSWRMLKYNLLRAKREVCVWSPGVVEIATKSSSNYSSPSSKTHDIMNKEVLNTLSI